jgi:hypothetical protein
MQRDADNWLNQKVVYTANVRHRKKDVSLLKEETGSINARGATTSVSPNRSFATVVDLSTTSTSTPICTRVSCEVVRPLLTAVPIHSSVS